VPQEKDFKTKYLSSRLSTLPKYKTIFFLYSPLGGRGYIYFKISVT